MKLFLLKITFFTALICAILTCSLFFLPNNRATESILGALPAKHKILASQHSPKIIFVGGSNLAFGLDSKTIQKQIGMPVVNTGIHASIGLKYQLNDILRFIKKGDIVIVSPEYGQFYTRTFYGNTELVSVLFDIFPQGRNLVDLKQWHRLSTIIPQYAASKLRYHRSHSYNREVGVYDKRAFNEYGDAYIHWGLPVRRVAASKRETGKEVINSDCVAFLQLVEKKINAKSAQMFILPPAYQSSSYDNQATLIQKIFNELSDKGLPVLANPAKYRFADSLFFDTNYHLTKSGVDLRTSMVIDNLKQANLFQAIHN
ncbi:hypothetical protein [Dyadobacter aurulentus]|uniref:hypothetical protein n=1 Tax=Dyadobacter sp. UC 10 TaxID=2605428 RepID=UPI0011F1B1A6|nr:hypothetical protein [Dyadobacter sp. UC 10]KAA0991322.1 hypothetical protein FXO21_14700 [Dyadobacter sp. UC 10]